jgi:putative redox protein
MEMKVDITVRTLKNLQVEISDGRHQWYGDEAVDVGGEDTAPSAENLLLGALGACKVITAHLYARRKQWPLESAEISLKMSKIYARECDDCTSEPDAKVSIIESQITFHGDLSTEQRERLAEIADRCPVHRTLTGEVKIRTRLL